PLNLSCASKFLALFRPSSLNSKP
ncbi:hypothetical protein VCHC41B1_1090B, partial [Vibrio cholerae HC-41B1]